MIVSVVIRTFNEEEHLSDLLDVIRQQELEGFQVEVIVVDSGSTDSTLSIAGRYGCNIVHILKEEFTFGRSLNIGCEAARGDFLVFVSGHCIPTNNHWLSGLIGPLRDGKAVYSYGRQIGNGVSKFSEHQLFRKYYPDISKIPQEGFFCNNANAALKSDVWKEYKFNEEITGLEDMELAKRITESGHSLAYIASAAVYHIHQESWGKVKTRYEREAIALQYILPEVHVRFPDFLRYVFSAVLLDLGSALQEKKLLKVFSEVLAFRLMQFWGVYRGNHEHRRLSREMKERYFYPR